MVRGQVIPAIEARGITGFRHIDLLRREAGGETEFTAIMQFDDLASVRAFAGEDHETAHVSEAARLALARWDVRVPHHEVIDRRPQG